MEGEAVGFHNILACARDAWLKVSVLKYDVATGEVENIITSGFRKAGIFPFNPAAFDPSLYGPALAFEAQLAPKKAPHTEEEILAVVEANNVQFVAGTIKARLEGDVNMKRKGAVPGATLLTGDQHVANYLAALDEKGAEAIALEERKKSRLERAEAEREEKTAKAAVRVAKRAAKEARIADKVKRVNLKGKGRKAGARVVFDDDADAVEELRRGAKERRAKKAAAKRTKGGQ